MVFIRENFPALESMYLTRYENAAFVPKAYAERCRDLLHAACRKHGLAQRSSDRLITRDVGIPPSLREQESLLFPVSALGSVPRKPPQPARIG
jgi:hypothetical protein